LPEYALYAWGYNSYGKLGLNIPTTDNRSSPVQVGTLTDWTQVAVYSHSLAIKKNNTLWSWGNNASGQLGQNDVVLRSSQFK
jgi:alpha-tubulin suppressor-like RCC1 family protein